MVKCLQAPQTSRKLNDDLWEFQWLLAVVVVGVFKALCYWLMLFCLPTGTQWHVQKSKDVLEAGKSHHMVLKDFTVKQEFWFCPWDTVNSVQYDKGHQLAFFLFLF